MPIYQKHIFLHAPYHANGTTLTSDTLAAALNLTDAFLELNSTASFPDSGHISVNGVGDIVYATKDDGTNKLFLAEPSTLTGLVGEAVVLLFDLVDTTKDKDGRTYANCVKIKNLDAVNDLNVSFDGGTNYYPVAAGATLTINSQVYEVCLSSSAPVEYNIVCTATR